jgi:transcriptional regulator with XRE-family HTH domain
MARRLQTLRARSGLTLDEVAKKMEWSSSKIGRWETGEALPEIHGLKSLLDIYGVPAGEWPELLEMCRAARTRGWWRALGVDDRGYVPVEADARQVCEFNPSYVPGLLQTADYARALFRAVLHGATSDELRQAVSVRMIRQKRLTAERDPLELVAVMDESALYRPVGGPAAMAAQLAHLIEASALDRVTLQVLPMSVGAHPCVEGGLFVLSFDRPDEPDIACTEHTIGFAQTEREERVARAKLKFDRLRSDALSPDDSVALIRKAAERYPADQIGAARGPHRPRVAQE